MTDHRTQTEKTHTATEQAQIATDALSDLFNQLMTMGGQEKPKFVDALAKRIESHQSVIRVHIDMDTDGPLSFLFMEINEAFDAPRLVFDLTPRGFTKQ